MAARRPTHKELASKIAAARVAFKTRNVVAVNAPKFASQMSGLGIAGQDELLELLGDVLAKIGPRDYAGRRPPERCAETGFEDREMFAFQVDSDFVGAQVYIKFVFAGERLGLVSLHETTRGE